MNISVIGTGNMGMAIARSLAKAGHQIYISGHSPEKTQAAVSTLQQEFPHGTFTAAPSGKDAVEKTDIIILTLWYFQHDAFVKEIGNAADGKIVVSNANPFPKPGVPEIPEDTSVAEMLAALLPKSIIVKAFNTAFAADYANPQFAGIKPDMFVAADDEQALTKVCTLVADSGFNPVNAGKLTSARVLEQMMIMLGGIGTRENYNWLAGWKILHQ